MRVNFEVCKGEHEDPDGDYIKVAGYKVVECTNCHDKHLECFLIADMCRACIEYELGDR